MRGLVLSCVHMFACARACRGDDDWMMLLPIEGWGGPLCMLEVCFVLGECADGPTRGAAVAVTWLVGLVLFLRAW